MASTINASTTLGLISSADTSGVLQLQTANTTAVTIDASQNVGVGTASPAYKLDVQTAAGRFQVRDLGGSSIKLVNSTTGGNIGIDSAGGITLIYANGTETARFDASGNLGIGTTTPSNRVSIVTASGSDGIVSVKSPTTDTAGVTIDGGSTSNKGALLTLAKDGTTKWRIGLDSAIGGGTSNNLNILGSSTDALLFGTNATERARIDSSGRMGIGTGNPNERLTLASGAGTGAAITFWGNGGTSGNEMYVGQGGSNEAYCWNRANQFLAFGTNGLERARFTSGGYFKASNTSAYYSPTGNYHEFNNSVGDYTVICRNNASSLPYGIYVRYNNSSPNGTGSEFLSCDDSTATRATIRSNGGLANYSANNVNLSDVRTKTDIQDAGSYLSKICAIPVRTFKYKDQTDDLLNLGCIAQEVEAVAPELVDVSGFGETPEDGVPLKAIYQTDLQYALMKCIQEQQAIIQQLQADVAALKG